jgi:predicted RNase H-like nuclease (RuvC/YqgF family)
MSLSGNLKEYDCPNCDASFRTRLELAVHMPWHEPQTAFTNGEQMAILNEVDRLRAELTAANSRIQELTQTGTELLEYLKIDMSGKTGYIRQFNNFVAALSKDADGTPSSVV